MRENTVADYSIYKHRVFREHNPSQETIFVIPESWAWLAPRFVSPHSKAVLWWLSVDNAFGALQQLNLNHLQSKGIIHAAQSAYARRFLDALGIESLMLSDYTTPPSIHPQPITKRPYHVAINAGHKVAIDLQKLSDSIRQLDPRVEITAIRGLTKQAVTEAFSTSRLFIDMGNFPGKDRMVREAMLLGTPVVTSTTGAGHGDDDFSLPDYARVNALSISEASAAAARILADPSCFDRDFSRARRRIAAERSVFMAEVTQVAAAAFRISAR